jgi:tight adherence protein C
MTIQFWTAVLATAASAASTGHAFLTFMMSPTRDVQFERAPPPWLIRPVWRVARRFAPAVAERAPTFYLARTAARLRAAELERSVTPAEWVAVRLTYAVTGVVAAIAAATATDVSLWLSAIGGAAVAGWLPEARIRAVGNERARAIRRELPLYLDVLTLAVESGSSLTGAIAMAVEKADDGPLRRALLRLLADVRAGRARSEALKAMEQSLGLPETTAFVGALLQSERTGSRLGDVLRHQSNQRSQERFARAEKAAMQAPVRMLGPLVLCIFPCTFIVLGYPIVVKLMAGL